LYRLADAIEQQKQNRGSEIYANLLIIVCYQQIVSKLSELPLLSTGGFAARHQRQLRIRAVFFGALRG
jgi:hypothetical protein